MGAMQLEFRIFSPETAQASRQAWLAEANNAGLAFGPEVSRLFDWVDSHLTIVENDAVAFGVFEKGENVALGISEIAIQRKTSRSKWVKMLRLHLRPSLDATLQDGDAELAMNVFVESMQGSMNLQLTHLANTLKVYGRTNEQLNFLRALLSRLQVALQGKSVKAAIEGRFLSIVVN